MVRLAMLQWNRPSEKEPKPELNVKAKAQSIIFVELTKTWHQAEYATLCVIGH